MLRVMGLSSRRLLRLSVLQVLRQACAKLRYPLNVQRRLLNPFQQCLQVGPFGHRYVALPGRCFIQQTS